jgi:hypothetical protein
MQQSTIAVGSTLSECCNPGSTFSGRAPLGAAGGDTEPASGDLFLFGCDCAESGEEESEEEDDPGRRGGGGSGAGGPDLAFMEALGN